MPDSGRSPRNRSQISSEQAASKILYLAVHNLDGFRGPTAGDHNFGLKETAGRIPDTMTATVTYTDGLMLSPVPSPARRKLVAWSMAARVARVSLSELSSMKSWMVPSKRTVVTGTPASRSLAA